MCTCRDLINCKKCRKAHGRKIKQYAALGIEITPLPPLPPERLNRNIKPPQLTCMCLNCRKCRHREYMRQWRRRNDPQASQNVAFRKEVMKLRALDDTYQEDVLRRGCV